jgi:hypothetical protein
MTPQRVWAALAVFYALFFGWYTSFGGPLTPDEIESYVAALTERGADPVRLERWRRFMEDDTGDDFAMLNAIQLRDTPKQVEGVHPGDTSAEVLARYTEPFLGRALRSAAHPVLYGFAGRDALDLWGIEGAERWNQGAAVRYRSRRDLMEQAVAVGPSGIHDFKVAAMEKTIAFPLDPFYQLGDPRFVLALLVAVAGLAWHLRCALRPEPAH